MMTMAMPASKAVPTLSVSSERVMFLPRPGASMSAVMTTIESASIIVWLMARTICGRAIGTWTLRSVWRRVEPIEVAASTVDSLTPRMP